MGAFRAIGWFGLRMIGMLLLAGCAHKGEDRDRSFGRVMTPQSPAFLSGPAGMLLTNSQGYVARVTAAPEPALAHQGPVEGELLVQGSRLLFAPGKSDEKRDQGAGFSYVWDVAAGRGYVLSEALQGYAPVSTSLRATNVVLSPGTAAQEAAVQMDDGSTARFQVWRSDKSGVPGRVSSVGMTPPVSVSLSKIRVGPLPPGAFEPPVGFNKYPSSEALADELALRRHNLRRSNRDSGVSQPMLTPQYR